MTRSSAHPAPRAIRLDDGGPDGAARRLPPAVRAEPEPVEAEPPAPEPAPARSGFGWGKLFAAALGGFVSLALWLWAERTVRDLLATSPMLGYAALVLLGLAALALAVMLGRLVADLVRARRVDALKQRAEAIRAAADMAGARTLAREIAAMVAGRPETARGRAALEAALPELMAARDVLTVAERELLAPLDAEAAALTARAARQVSVVTAVSPRAIVDVVFVLYACARLLRNIAGVYGGRPGTLGLIKLARGVFVHLVVTGGMAAGDTLLQQLMGQGLAARVSAKLGEGVLNGLLTARVGLSAIALTRPMDFAEEPQPSLSDVAGELLSRGGPVGA